MEHAFTFLLYAAGVALLAPFAIFIGILLFVLVLVIICGVIAYFID